LAQVGKRQFIENLRQETALLKDIFDNNEIHYQKDELGIELELSLLNHDLIFSDSNKQFIQKLNNELIDVEGHISQIEIHTKVRDLSLKGIEQLFFDLDLAQKNCGNLARQTRQLLLYIGSYPLGNKKNFSKAHLTPKARYFIINEALNKMRKENDIKINISGKNQLQENFDSLGIMGGLNALQIHMLLSPQKLVKAYNTLLLLSGALLAVSANSTFFLKKQLWNETRIPLFENIFQTEGFTKHTSMSRVLFGNFFIKESLFELFQDNLDNFQVVLANYDISTEEPFAYCRLHNSTIYRWIRPVFDVMSNKKTLRLELRFLPSGPTNVDSKANFIFLMGLYFALENTVIDFNQLAFHKVKQSFYDAAQLGLHTQYYWLDKKTHDLKTLLLDELIPLAIKGLKLKGFATQQNLTLMEIIKQRTKTEQTGSKWQRLFTDKHDSNINTMLKNYIYYQNKNIPVHQWPV